MTFVPFWNLHRLIQGKCFDFHRESRLVKHPLKPLENQNQFAHYLWVGFICFHMTLSRKLANVSNSSPDALEKRLLSLWISTAPLSYTKTCRYEHRGITSEHLGRVVAHLFGKQSKKGMELVFFCLFCFVLVLLFLGERGQWRSVLQYRDIE